MFEGLKTAPPVSTAAVFTLTPIIAAGFGWLLLRQITTARIALALVIGGAGAVWVIFRADLAALMRFQVGKGEITYFWGCVAHALYTPLVRKLNRGESPVAFSFGVLISGFVMLTVWGWGDIIATDWRALPGIAGDAALYGVLCKRRDLCAFAICRAQAACVEGHGLYISDAFMGHPVGDCARQPRALGLVLRGLPRRWWRWGCWCGTEGAKVFEDVCPSVGMSDWLDFRGDLPLQKPFERIEVQLLEHPEPPIQTVAVRIASGMSLHQITRPRRSWAMRPASARVLRCFEMAARDMSKGSATSVTAMSSSRSMVRIARRVGSARAAKIWSRRVSEGRAMAGFRRARADRQLKG